LGQLLRRKPQIRHRLLAELKRSRNEIQRFDLHDRQSPLSKDEIRRFNGKELVGKATKSILNIGRIRKADEKVQNNLLLPEGAEEQEIDLREWTQQRADHRPRENPFQRNHRKRHDDLGDKAL
jgi:hypothetical protein